MKSSRVFFISSAQLTLFILSYFFKTSQKKEKFKKRDKKHKLKMEKGC